VLQLLPTGQVFMQTTPQSTSPSAPLWMPSVQLGAWQVPASQVAVSQSAWPVQLCPIVQSVGQAAPQSTSPSAPLWMPSVQLGAQVPPSQIPPRQSEGRLQL
jgi:hypothetical protein